MSTLTSRGSIARPTTRAGRARLAGGARIRTPTSSRASIRVASRSSQGRPLARAASASRILVGAERALRRGVLRRAARGRLRRRALAAASRARDALLLRGRRGRTVLVSAEHAELAAPLAATLCDVRALEPLLGASEHIGAVTAAALATGGDAPALQLYTSGTTGKPKGAVLTHTNLAVQQELVGEAWGFGRRATRCSTRCRSTTCTASPSRCSPRSAPAPTTRLTHVRRRARSGTRWQSARSSWPCRRCTTGSSSRSTPPTRRRARDGRRTPRALRLATSGSAALPVTLAERWRADHRQRSRSSASA